MITGPIAAGEIRRLMEESLGLREPPRKRRANKRRTTVRAGSALALRRLADRLEPEPDPARSC